MTLKMTPGAKRSMAPCQCGHRAGLHDRYNTGPCRAQIGLGRTATRCACRRFTPANPTTNPTQTHTSHVS